MNRLPAASGLQWIRDGFMLFRRQPNQLSLLFLLYVMVNLLLAFIPLIGSLLLFVLNQVFTTAFMLGCALSEAGREAKPGLLFTYLRGPVLPRLAGLGVLYVVAVLLAIGAMYLYGGGPLVDAVVQAQGSTSGTVNPETQNLVVRTVFFGMSIYMILIFPLWFAAPLIAWQGMGVAKAIFFSFFSVLRAIKAFIAYILAWTAISLFISINLSALLSLLPGMSEAMALAVMIPCALFLSMLRYCSFYPSYVEVFGKPALPPQD